MTGVYGLNISFPLLDKVILGQMKVLIFYLLMWCLFYGAEKTSISFFTSDPRQMEG